MNILLWQASVLTGLDAELEAFSNTSLLQFFQQQPGVVLASALCSMASNSCVSYWQQLMDARQMLA